MKVCLYGDSYVDDDAVSTTKVNSWTEQLKNDYDNVLNFGKCGSGPEYSLSLLRKHGGDLIIFITGNPERLPFADLPRPGLQVDVANLYYRKWPIKDAKRVLSPYLFKHASNIKYMYRSFKDSILHRTEEIISYLHYYAHTHRSYVLCIPTSNPFISEREKMTRNGAAIDIPIAIQNHFNSKYFALYPYNLASVSLNEYHTKFKQTIKSSIGYIDLRQNHLSQCNHDILYNNISHVLMREPVVEHKLHFLDYVPRGDTYIYDA